MMEFRWCGRQKICITVVERVFVFRFFFLFFFRGADLEKTIAEVRGGDEATALRRLADLLRSVHSEFKVARRLGESAAEAAAKCQVCICYFTADSAVAVCMVSWRVFLRSCCLTQTLRLAHR